MRSNSCLPSLFGVSKLAANVVVQEYGRYFGMHTACFRGGCLTGPGHSGTKLHGFLAYLAKCAVTGEPYTVMATAANRCATTSTPTMMLLIRETPNNGGVGDGLPTEA